MSSLAIIIFYKTDGIFKSYGVWFGRPGFSLDAARVYSNKLHGEEARAILEHIYHHSIMKVEIQVIMPSYIDLVDPTIL